VFYVIYIYIYIYKYYQAMLFNHIILSLKLILEHIYYSDLMILSLKWRLGQFLLFR
jgi:hypothetical protein